MSRVFIAGAGTDVGKTHVGEALLRQASAHGRSVRAFKPVASGTPEIGDPAFAQSDVARLLRAAGEPIETTRVEACSPWRFRAPLAPDMAARLEDRQLRLADVADWTRAEIAREPVSTFVLVEGVGGVMSPICEDATTLDLAAALGCPLLLVGGSYLGAISHVATAWQCARLRGLPLLGIVVSETAGSPVGLAETVERIARFSIGATVVTFARNAGDASPPLSTLVAV